MKIFHEILWNLMNFHETFWNFCMPCKMYAIPGGLYNIGYLATGKNTVTKHQFQTPAETPFITII
jgi:hypothetical protein